jgi:serine/threonine-protein kinase
MSDDRDPLTGTPYRTLCPLGAGAMGEVFDAEHVKLGCRVAVKVLRRKDQGRPDLVDRMRLEGQALAHVEHPGVVRVLDLGTTFDGQPYLVMERLWGRTLREELAARRTLPPGEAIALVIQALEGLAAVHGAGLLHRDLKLDNIFVCDAAPGLPRAVKLLDFGVAKVIHPGGPAPLAVPTDEGVSMGTPRFFSPEQAAGERLDARSDVYSMGMVLYALVAGRGPFDHLSDLAAILDAHMEAQPDVPSRWAPVPIPLEAVILRALAKRPEHRWQSAAAFAAALRRVGAMLAKKAPSAASAPLRFALRVLSG